MENQWKGPVASATMLEFGDPENVSVFAYSPDGSHFARAVHSKVIVENLSLRSVLKSVSLPDRVDRLEWSGDSSYLACGSLDSGVIKIFSVDNPQWKCKIDVGSEDIGVGLEDLTWGPNARNLLTTAAHYVEITVWSLCTDQVFHIRDILPVGKNKSFDGSGKKMAVGQFSDNFATCVGIYSTDTWERLVRFRVACKDLDEICWCPNDSSILLRDSSLFCGLFIYSPSGDLLKHFTPDGLAPGLPIAQWSPTGQFLMTVNHRNTIRILNGLTFGVIVDQTLDPNVLALYPKCHKYTEVLLDELRAISGLTSYHKELDQLVVPTNDSFVVKSKLTLKFCWDGRYAAVHTNSYPTAVWIWDLAVMSLAAVLVHINSVTDFDWQPLRFRLLICTGTDVLYSWCPANASIQRISTSSGNKIFRCTGIKWSPAALQVALTSKEDKLIKCTIANED